MVGLLKVKVTFWEKHWVWIWLVFHSFLHWRSLSLGFLIGEMKISAYPHPTKMVLRIKGSNFKFLIMIHKKLIRSPIGGVRRIGGRSGSETFSAYFFFSLNHVSILPFTKNSKQNQINYLYKWLGILDCWRRQSLATTCPWESWGPLAQKSYHSRITCRWQFNDKEKKVGLGL